jgi:hypothetical protein
MTMMNAIWLTLTLAVAQQPVVPPPQDTGEAGRLRRQIEERFAQRVQQDLGLTPDQAAKLRGTQEKFGERRRVLMRQQVDRRMALQGQMRPGEAANPDSVKKLMDGMQAGRGDLFKLEQDEDREMGGYLTPVQRARYQMMRQRFLARVSEMRQQRDRRGRVGQGGPMGPGPRARPQGGGRRPGRRPI